MTMVGFFFPLVHYTNQYNWIIEYIKKNENWLIAYDSEFPKSSYAKSLGQRQ